AWCGQRDARIKACWKRGVCFSFKKHLVLLYEHIEAGPSVIQCHAMGSDNDQEAYLALNDLVTELGRLVGHAKYGFPGVGLFFHEVTEETASSLNLEDLLMCFAGDLKHHMNVKFEELGRKRDDIAGDGNFVQPSDSTTRPGHVPQTRLHRRRHEQVPAGVRREGHPMPPPHHGIGGCAAGVSAFTSFSFPPGHGRQVASQRRGRASASVLSYSLLVCIRLDRGHLRKGWPRVQGRDPGLATVAESVLAGYQGVSLASSRGHLCRCSGGYLAGRRCDEDSRGDCWGGGSQNTRGDRPPRPTPQRPGSCGQGQRPGAGFWHGLRRISQVGAAEGGRDWRRGGRCTNCRRYRWRGSGRWG
ncbi:unnamed protein product, partial [Ectocarpus fasciculatus]